MMLKYLLATCFVALAACAPQTATDNSGDATPEAKTSSPQTALYVPNPDSNPWDGRPRPKIGEPVDQPSPIGPKYVHPIGGPDFVPYPTDQWHAFFKSDPAFCLSLNGLSLKHIRGALESKGELSVANGMVHKMLCEDYFGKTETAASTAYRIIALKDISEQVDRELEGLDLPVRIALAYLSRNNIDRGFSYSYAKPRSIEFYPENRPSSPEASRVYNYAIDTQENLWGVKEWSSDNE